jgi:hypothetical protein
MSFGSLGSVGLEFNSQSVSDARMMLDLVALVVDKDGVTARIKKLVEARELVDGAAVELRKREHLLSDREVKVKQREAALAAAESRAAELLARAQAKEQRAEEATATLAQLRAEIRQKLPG